MDRKGIVLFHGRSLEKDHEEVCRDIAYVGTDFDFSLNTKVKTLRKIYRDFYSEFDEQQFESLCEKSDITLKSKLSQLSLGQNKLLQLYLAICRKPVLLILDEPTAGLDVIVRDELLDMLRDYMEQNEDCAIIISSHISSDLEGLCDDLYMIDQGKIVMHEETDVLLSDYAILKVDEEQFYELDKQYLLCQKERKFWIPLFN